jgi:hypothetical protein
LGLDDLFFAVGPDLDHTLVVSITSMRDAQKVLTGRQRFENDSA